MVNGGATQPSGGLAAVLTGSAGKSNFAKAMATGLHLYQTATCHRNLQAVGNRPESHPESTLRPDKHRSERWQPADGTDGGILHGRDTRAAAGNRRKAARRAILEARCSGSGSPRLREPCGGAGVEMASGMVVGRSGESGKRPDVLHWNRGVSVLRRALSFLSIVSCLYEGRRFLALVPSTLQLCRSFTAPFIACALPKSKIISHKL